MAKLGDLIDVCQGRLTLTSGTPVTTSDVTAATTVYFCPYKGNSISFYSVIHDEWVLYEYTERSITLSGLAADTNLDVFMYNSAGTITLELVAWSDATTRATALAVQDGIYVKSGELTKRYLGTIRTTSTTGQCEDSEDKRFVWNYYNQVPRRLYIDDTTGHNESGEAWHSWNGDNTIRLELVIGLVETPIDIRLHGSMTAAFAGDTNLIGVAHDSTSTPLDNSLKIHNYNDENMSAGTSMPHISDIGYHYYQAIEYGTVGSYFAAIEIMGVIHE